jgi:hypothetical protein
VLTGGEVGAVERHQTLRAAIDWSYDLLDDTERRLFDRLSVFVGGFTLSGAEAVTAGNGIQAAEVFDLLASLVARSLVVADTAGVEARYRLLETIRQYAGERLEADRETIRLRDTHARYFTALAERSIAGLLTSRALEWLRLMAREVDNVRAALAWGIENKDAELVLRLFSLKESSLFVGFFELGQVLHPAAASALSLPGIAEDARYPMVLACAAEHAGARGNLEEMNRYCDEALAAEERLGVGPTRTLSVATAKGNLASAEGRVDGMIEHAERSVGLLRARQDDVRLASSLGGLALARSLKGEDLTVAVSEAEEALTLAERTANPIIMSMVQANAAFVLADTQPDRARVLMDSAIRFGELGPLKGARARLSMLGDVAERLSDRRRALEYFVISMEEFHWMGQSELCGRMLRRIGLLFVGHAPETAAVLIGAGLARSRSATLSERAFTAQEQGIQALDAALGTDRCRELRMSGAGLDEHKAVELARITATDVLSVDAP